MQIDLLGQNVLVQDLPSQFEIRIGDGAVRVAEGDQLVADPRGEGSAPDGRVNVGVSSGRQPGSPHAMGGGIMGTHSCWMVWHCLGQLRGTLCQGVGKMFKVG